MDFNESSNIDNESIIINHDDLIYLLNEELKTAKLIDNDLATGDIFIPRFIIYKDEEFTVTTIDDYSFKNTTSIRSIIFPNNSEVQMIGKGAFAESSIESIFIGPHITFIGERAFFNCKNLYNVEISPDSLIQTIEAETFYNTSIIKIFIPPHVTQISERAFFDCGSLQCIEIPPYSELKTICSDAFSYIYQYKVPVRDLIIPASVIELKKKWFSGLNKVYVSQGNPIFKNYGENDEFIIGKSDMDSDEYDILVFVCNEIENIIIPPFIRKIGPYAFMNSIANYIYIPEQVTQICKAAFSNTKIQKIDISLDSKLEIIESSAFAGSKIEKINIPSNITKISKKTFADCFELTNIYIPFDTKINTIEKKAFFNTSIESISIPSNVKLEEDWCIGTDKLFNINIIPNIQQNIKLFEDK